MKNIEKCLKWPFLALASLFLVSAAGVLYLTAGTYWSVDTYVYGFLLHGIPTPPGYVDWTDYMNLQPYHSSEFRRYSVDAEHTEVVDFYLARLAEAGWELVAKDARRLPGVSDVEPEAYFEHAGTVFSYHQRYWLRLEVSTYVTMTAQGAQSDAPLVLMEISRYEQNIMFSTFGNITGPSEAVPAVKAD